MWATTLGLVFGGCCSNAVTLEQLTVQYPQSGSLITFFQFFIISIYGLPRHIQWTASGPRFKPRSIPLAPYIAQVLLFYVISLFNNAAFGYRIPMSVHIIFRSGGLVITMLLGWLVANKKYNLTQVLSVLVVTIGVIITTLSASPSDTGEREADLTTYLTGILILTIALVLSGFLGLVQDYTYTTYRTPQSPTPSAQESMFYLHFLSLPMFFFIRKDIARQLATINRGNWISYSLTLPDKLSSWINSMTLIPPPLSLPFSYLMTTRGTHALQYEQKFLSLERNYTQPTQTLPSLTVHLGFPHAYIPLFLNTVTQLLCVSGVHRLTTRVTALTVTLVLVVRKAVSLILSVSVNFGTPASGSVADVDQRLMWTGAMMVLIGTAGYSVGTGRKSKSVDSKEKKE